MNILTPQQLRRVIVDRAIQKFQQKWLQEVTNGIADEDIRVRISGIANFELILNEFDPSIYTVYKQGGDTYVKMV